MERSSIFIPTISARILTALFVSIGPIVSQFLFTVYTSNFSMDSDDGSSMQTDQPFPEQGFAPPCPDESKPRVGMLFLIIEDGIAFYNNYAALVGFDTRKSTSTKSRDGVIVWQYVVCNREGRKNVSSMPRPLAQDREDSDPIPKKKRRCISNRIGCKARVTLRLSGNVGYSIVFFEEHHNHHMLSAPCRPFLKLNRNLDIGHKKFILNCAKANIGTMKSYRLFKESVGGYDNIGATAVDFKNFKRDLKAYIAGGDAQMVIDKLFRKHETCSAFFFEYDVDESDQLTRLFWCDPVARKNYSLFGDVVSFDATYETNRYNMIFAPFTGVDNHCKCITFGAGLLTREDDESYSWLFRCFLNAMGNSPKCIITDQDPSLRGAAQKFESAMDSQRHKNADLNADDEACYPEFKTPLDIEHHAASVYTITIFYEVQMEISEACFSCRVLHVDELD
ncbi:unnamed protein product [Cuscuta campestris]|uniref:Protein FAR1-RELATED SEQUENCE n=1 Tax=Cuscuta campestris TaxID=132261 RepID=A0A484MZF6_9ASTE|nr:unnamed protein product [Cuscuta campestris]VFQ93398.1 unnamed protein product [Cuscuta campestris]